VVSTGRFQAKRPSRLPSVTLQSGKRFRIKHDATGKYLHTHKSKFDQSNCGAQCPIAGQQEVTAYQVADDENNWWKTAEGVFFPNVA